MNRSLAVAAVMLLVGLSAIAFRLLSHDNEVLRVFAPKVATLAFAISFSGLVLSMVAYQLRQDFERTDRLLRVEDRFEQHPDKPQLAWDLARTKLENYLDRNLSQVTSIYWLTALVMLAGFSFVGYGLWKAFDNPDRLAVSIVASASGVIISFIGGSFLLVHRSILLQAKDYVTVLERINAVGMAVQVIANIPDDNAQLKHETTAELARQLLGMYAGSAPASRISPISGSS